MKKSVVSSLLLSSVCAALLTLGVAVQHVLAQGEATRHFDVVDGALYRPDFTFDTPDGQSRSIGEWEGKVVLLDFWASWCIPCRKEMPVFNQLQAAYSDQGFEVIGLAADELEKVQQFLVEVPVDFPILYGDVFDVMDVSAKYGNSIGGLPFSVFIDRAGNVRYTQKPGEVSYEEAEEILKRLL